MTDRPIILAPWEVRALLDGRKTQTRRMAWRKRFLDLASKTDDARAIGWQVEPYEPTEYGGRYLGDHRSWFAKPTIWQSAKPGDRLWVRETWIQGWEADGEDVHYCDEDGNDLAARLWYRADNDLDMWVNHHGQCTDRIPWKPSIHMFRWASRLTLIVTGWRIERVRDINGLDALAEGVTREAGVATWRLFRRLWISLYGPDAWDRNDEVVALTFEVVARNIDQISGAEVMARLEGNSEIGAGRLAIDPTFE